MRAKASVLPTDRGRGAGRGKRPTPRSRPRWSPVRAGLLLTLALALAPAGCQCKDENPLWDPPEEHPSWTYDAPFYYRPSEELAAVERTGPDIPVYYPACRRFFIKHAGGYQLPGVPRVGVWFSADAGRNWRRAGYFGVEQTHLLFHADADGPYWIRFVGPGQGIYEAPPGMPHRIYVVDTTPPEIELSVDRAPGSEEEGDERARRTFRVGERAVVRWRVRDANLLPDSVRLATAFAGFPDNVPWTILPAPLPATGTVLVPIPPEASARPGQDGGGMRFRLQARDKAGNLGMAFSEVLYAAPPAPTTQWVAPPPGQWTPATQPTPAPAERPGWPEAGALLRGRARRLLAWLPEEVAKHDRVLLEFSSNGGRSWRIVAEDLRPDRPVEWTVPAVNSKLCRLRIVAPRDDGGRVMLAVSRPFTVHTAPPAAILGPEPVPPNPSAQ